MMGWFSESREMNPWAEGVYLHLSLMLHHLLSLGSKKEQSFFLRGYCRGFLLQGFRQFLSVYADKFDLGLVLHTSEFINLGWPVKIFYRGIKFYWLSVAYFKEKKKPAKYYFSSFFPRIHFWLPPESNSVHTKSWLLLSNNLRSQHLRVGE